VETATSIVGHPRRKPRLRGVSHALAFFLTPAVVLAVEVVAASPRATHAGLIYAATLAALFGVSALYHCPMWSLGARRVLRRVDHSMIFLFIAGTYTAFSLALPAERQATLLAVTWSASALGVARVLFWPSAPRVVSVGSYLAVGWLAVPFLKDLSIGMGVNRIALVLAGGVLYSAGAVIYARRSPDPFPRVFGFHEIFHVLVIAAASLHLAVVLGLLQQVGPS
jgi:hemolysin III